MLERPEDEGLLVGQGTEFSGWALFVQGGKGVYVSNCVKVALDQVRTPESLPVGREFALRYEYEPVDIGVGTVRLLVNGAVVASREGVRTAPMGFSNVTEGLQIGRGWATAIAYEHYSGSFPFSGTLRVVELQTDPTSQLQRSNFLDPGDVVTRSPRG